MRALLLAAVLVSVIAAPALANDPSMESCVKYAEADSAFLAVTKETRTKDYKERVELGDSMLGKRQQARRDYEAARDRAYKAKRAAEAPIYEKSKRARAALEQERDRAVALLPGKKQLYSDEKTRIDQHFYAEVRRLGSDVDRAKAPITDIYNAAVEEAKNAHEAIRREIAEEEDRLANEIEDAYRIAVAEPEAERRRIYEEAYEGPVSDNPKIMDKLRLRHRKRCKTLYDM